MAISHFLLTSATLQEFLNHMSDVSPTSAQDALIDTWQAAQVALGRLPEREAGCADLAAVLPLPPAMKAQSDAVSQSPEVNEAHRLVPVAFGLVEFDALMTTRRTLSEPKLAAVRSAIAGYPDDPELARVCLSLAAPPARVSATRWDGRQLLIVTEAEDLRMLRCEALPGGLLPGTVVPGVARSSLQMVLGSALPVMHAVQFNGRVLLVKGHHRARVLRSMGVTFLPCLISACSGIDDVLAAAPTLDRKAVENCFSQSRPTMLRDFDRSAFTHSHEALPRQRLLQVRVEVTSQWLPSVGKS